MSSVVSITSGRSQRKGTSGEYLLLELVRPGEEPRNIGVLLRDIATGQVYPRIREHFEDIEDPEEAQLLAALRADFDLKIKEMTATSSCARWKIPCPMRSASASAWL